MLRLPPPSPPPQAHPPPLTGGGNAAQKVCAVAVVPKRGQNVPEMWKLVKMVLNIERKWGDHHGVKSDMMDALLGIDVNPHLRIVG